MGDSSAPSGATTGSHEVAFAAGVSKPVGSHTDDASRRALDVLAFPDEVDPLARTCVASDSIEQGRTSPASYKQATAQSNSVEGADRLSLSSDPPGSIAQRQDALRPHDVAGSDSLARLIDNEKDDVEHAGRPTEEPMVPRSRQSSQIVHGGTADSRATSAPVQGCNTATLVAAALTPVDVPLELGADPAAPKHAGFATKPVALESASVMLKPADGPDIVAAKAIAPYLDHFKDRSSFAELPSRTRLDMLLAVNTKISNAVRQGATGEMVEQLWSTVATATGMQTDQLKAKIEQVQLNRSKKRKFDDSDDPNYTHKQSRAPVGPLAESHRPEASTSDRRLANQRISPKQRVSARSSPWPPYSCKEADKRIQVRAPGGLTATVAFSTVDVALDSLPSSERDIHLLDILVRNQAEQHSHNYALPNPDADGIAKLAPLAPSIPLSVVAAPAAGKLAFQPLPSLLNYQIGRGDHSTLSWYFYLVEAFARSIEDAQRFVAFMGNKASLQRAHNAGHGALLAKWNKGILRYREAGGWDGILKRLFAYSGESDGFDHVPEDGLVALRLFAHFVGETRTRSLSWHAFLLQSVIFFHKDYPYSTIDIYPTFVSTASELPRSLSEDRVKLIEAVLSSSRYTMLEWGGANISACGNVNVSSDVLRALDPLPRHVPLAVIAEEHLIPSSLIAVLSRHASPDLTVEQLTEQWLAKQAERRARLSCRNGDRNDEEAEEAEEASEAEDPDGEADDEGDEAEQMSEVDDADEGSDDEEDKKCGEEVVMNDDEAEEEGEEDADGGKTRSSALRHRRFQQVHDADDESGGSGCKGKVEQDDNSPAGPPADVLARLNKQYPASPVVASSQLPPPVRRAVAPFVGEPFYRPLVDIVRTARREPSVVLAASTALTGFKARLAGGGKAGVQKSILFTTAHGKHAIRTNLVINTNASNGGVRLRWDRRRARLLVTRQGHLLRCLTKQRTNVECVWSRVEVLKRVKPATRSTGVERKTEAARVETMLKGILSG